MCVAPDVCMCNSGAYEYNCAISMDQVEIMIFNDILKTLNLCPPGTYKISNDSTKASVCQNCPAGTYNTFSGTTSISACIGCPAGAFSTAVGASSISACQTCPPGTYGSGGSGSSSCPSCPTGTFSSATIAGTCDGCPLGTFGTALGALNSSVCMSCPQGLHSLTVGSSSCQPCPPRTVSTSSSSSCLPCSSGYYLSQSSCNACASGFYCPVASISSNPLPGPYEDAILQAAGTTPPITSFTTSTVAVDSTTQSTAISSTWIQVIIVASGALLTGLAMLFIGLFAAPKFTSKFVTKMDAFFSTAHNTEAGKSPLYFPTRLGGILTIGVIVAFVTAGTIAMFSFVSPDNIIFSQTLSPIPLQLPANGTYQFIVSFLAPDSPCNATADVIIGFQGGSQRLTFTTDTKDKQTCVVTWTCDGGCSLIGLTQKIRLSMVTPGVNAAMISYSVSYPYYSQTSYGIQGGPIYPFSGIFRGNDVVTKVYITGIPTQLYMMGNNIIPSLSAPQQTLGIKLQYMSFQLGTTVDKNTYNEQNDVVGFEFEIDMSTTTLVVQEVQRQSLLNMIGSFAGLLGTILAIFRSVFPTTETLFEKIQKFISRKRTVYNTEAADEENKVEEIDESTSS
jgi:hypothetical protein